MGSGSTSTAVTDLASFVSTITGYLSDLLPYVWTIAGAAVALVGAYFGVKMIIRWFRGIK